jgi:AraC family transcriptional regulator
VTSRLELERGGVRATKVLVGRFEVQVLRFSPGHRIPSFEFDRGYLAIVLDGSLVKTFSRDTHVLGRDSVASLPAGAVHSTAFGPTPTRVVTVRGGPAAPLVRHVRGPVVASLARRLAVEVGARDTAWGLAAEGLVLQLLATASRDAEEVVRAPWLRDARDLLQARVPDVPASLTELAAAVGVHPSHLARSFRREYGQTVGEYARTLRLQWAAEQLALDGACLADVAVRSGFADQSHFTRAFRRHTGVTPGRYRELVKA